MGGEVLAFFEVFNPSIIKLNSDGLITVSGGFGNCKMSYTHVEEASHKASESSIPPVLFNSTIGRRYKKENVNWFLENYEDTNIASDGFAFLFIYFLFFFYLGFAFPFEFSP